MVTATTTHFEAKIILKKNGTILIKSASKLIKRKTGDFWRATSKTKLIKLLQNAPKIITNGK